MNPIIFAYANGYVVSQTYDKKSQSAKKVGNTAASNNHYNAGRKDFDSLCIGNDEPWRDHEDNDYVLRSPSLTSNKDSRNKNCLQDEEGCDNDNDNGEVPMSVVAKKTSKVPRANCNCERNSSDSMRYVIRKLTDMEMKINVMHKDIKIIGKRVEKDRTGTFETEEREKVDIFQDLPLKDENDLEAMETKLKNDLSYRNQMMTQLAFVLCANMKTSCLRLMKLMVSNELAIKYSWYGAKKKQIFSKLEICKVIISVIRKSFSEATDDKISAPIKIWLAHAKERITRNKEQEKENVPVNDVE